MCSAMRHDKAARLLDLARMLAGSSEGLTLDEMARALDVGRRTAERMRDAVWAAFPQMEAIEDPPTKRFRIPSGLDSLFQTPTAEELAALRTAADSYAASGAEARAAALYALERKLLSALRGSARRRVAPDVEALVQAETIAVHAGPRPFEDEQVLAAIRTAIKSLRAAEQVLYWCGCERQYCGGAATWPPSSAAACQGQRGSYSIARASATMSAWPDCRMMVSACCGSVIRPTPIVGSERFALDALGEERSGSRADRDLLQRRHAAARHVDEVAAAAFPAPGRRARSARCPSRPRPSRWPRCACRPPSPAAPRRARVEHLERKAHAVFQRAAVVVLAPVRQRRQELVQQVAVGAVQLDGVQAQRLRRAGRRRRSPA
jgi:hypothetical protein